MDIITVLLDFATSILAAQDVFFEHPEQLAGFERAMTDAGNRAVTRCMGITLSNLNGLIRDSSERKDRFDIQRQVQRTIITTVGDVTFEQTVFRDRETGKYRCLTEEILRLPMHERFSPLAEAKVLSEAEEHSYRHAAESVSYKGQTVSKTAVMEKVHKITEDLPEPTAEKKKRERVLYIEADEDHIHRQKDDREGCILGKLIYLFEGKKKVCEGRNALINPHYHGGLYEGTEGNERLWEEVRDYIEEHYDTDHLEKVYIASDGGAWIKAGKEYIPGSVLIADKFHLTKYINKASNLMLDGADDIKGMFYRHIHKNRKEELKTLLKRIGETSGREDVAEEVWAYFKNNWGAIQRTFHDPDAEGCSAEGHVSHVYSDRMSSRPMGWSETGSDRMCRLRCYVRNHGREKIIDLVEYRRNRQFEKETAEATGTDGIRISVTKKRTKAQMDIAKYAERIQASIGGTANGTSVKKILAIRERLNEI